MKRKPYDAAEFLTDEETIAAYLTEAFATSDSRVIAKALEVVARARVARFSLIG
jgi:probable addiction module antidote protein